MQFCIVLFYFGCLTINAQSLILSPSYLPLHKQYCKGSCIQFIDSSFYVQSSNPQPWADTIIKRMWYFSGTSTKHIPYYLAIGDPLSQPLYPFATDTFVFKTKQNPSLLCFDSVGYFDMAMGCQFANGSCFLKIWHNAIEIIDAPQITTKDIQHINLNFGDEYTLIACAKDSKYDWEPYNELGGCNTCDNYIAKPFSNTTYTCTITNINGCEKKCIYDVELKDPPETFYIPNSFTPNNDGLNDIFKPVSLNQKINSLSIYNRWGQKLMETIDENASWDGTHRDVKVEEGVYTYVIFYTTSKNNLVKRQTGVINLIR